MPGAGRLGDKAQVQGPGDAHGCPACPHPAIGPAIIGSPTVNVNGRPALRINDMGIHAACCGPNMWTAKVGSATVFINKLAAFRMNDMGQSCGGMTKLIEGSQNVLIGDAGGGGGGAGSGSASGNAAAGQGATGAGSPASGSPSSVDKAGRDGQAQKSSSRLGGKEEDAEKEPVKAWIEVEILDETGAPMKDMPYKLELPDYSLIEGQLDASGKVRRDQLEPGLARLWVPDLDDDHDPVPPVRPENDEAPTSFIDVEILDDEGRPAAHQPVKIELPDGTLVDDKLDENGRLFRDKLPAGKAKLHLVDAEATSRIAPPLPVDVPDEAKAFLDVVVTDGAGRPRPGLAVKVELPDGSVVEEKTDAHGRLRKEDIAAGVAKVHVPDDDTGSSAAAAPAAPAEEAEAKASLDVQILDSAGRPRAGLEVKVELPDGSVVTEKTDADGRLKKAGIDAGACQVHVPDEDDGGVAAPATAASPTADEAKTADFELEILDDAGRPRAGLDVTLELADGKRVDARTDAQGRVVQKGVPVGDVKVHLPE